MIKQYLYIKKIPGKGKGVFAQKKIDTHTLIEVSPVIVMSDAERALLDKTLLHDYIFEWGEDKSRCCIALGLVSIYNHSYTSNCEYFMDFEAEMIQIKTVRDINAGEELTINYNGDWNDKKQVWFNALGT